MKNKTKRITLTNKVKEIEQEILKVKGEVEQHEAQVGPDNSDMSK